MEEIRKDDDGFHIGDDTGNPLAKVAIRREPGPIIVIESTFVSDALKGRGIGALLVKAVAELARREKAKVLPLCSYARKVMTRDAEYFDVLIAEREASAGGEAPGSAS